ncbi:hypothetical protein Mpsy_2424 [Methanolobus psychrophilus R15]|nr:hypothetical protein Mpsy_2424 [Methanolobus psychrophilus R15]
MPSLLYDQETNQPLDYASDKKIISKFAFFIYAELFQYKDLINERTL